MLLIFNRIKWNMIIYEFMNLLTFNIYPYRFTDHKRDRFESYGRLSGGYHRDRERDRDRGMHINDKRRYVFCLLILYMYNIYSGLSP